MEQTTPQTAPTLDHTPANQPLPWDVHQKSNPAAQDSTMAAMFDEMRSELDRLKRENAILAKVHTTMAESAPSQAIKAPVRFEELLARHNWAGLNKMTRSQKANLLGADDSMTDDLLRKLFGRGCSAQFQQDYQRANPRQYAIAREFAKILQIYAN